MDIMKWLVLGLTFVVSMMGWKIVSLLSEIKRRLEGIREDQEETRRAERPPVSQWIDEPW